MRILFLTFGPPIVASSRTRVYHYLPFFQQDNISYKVINNFTGIPYTLTNYVSYANLKHLNNMLARIKLFALRGCVKIGHVINVLFSIVQIIRSVLLAILFSYDVIFIQKVFLPLFVVKIFKIFRKQIVFDFDDAIYTQHGFFRNKNQFDQLIPFYDLIVLENDETAQYIRDRGNDNVLVITGPIDTGRYKPGHRTRKDRIVIGWVGSPSTEQYLTIIKNVLERLCNKYSHLYFETIGAGNLDLGSTRLIQKQWRLDTEVDNLLDFDIGVMPLPDDDWSRGKGGYKLLQYMAMGIPCCTSPVGINKILIVDAKNGFLADTDEKWFEMLSILIDSEDMRIKMGKNGREMAEQLYSYETYYPKMKKSLLSLVNAPEAA